jgi:hypothetical protein
MVATAPNLSSDLREFVPPRHEKFITEPGPFGAARVPRQESETQNGLKPKRIRGRASFPE